jgi:Tat protein translocase TatB subunit
MFGMGFFELLIVIVVAIIAIGPDKLPQMFKAAGKAYTEFRRAGEELKRGITEPVKENIGRSIEGHIHGIGEDKGSVLPDQKKTEG